MFKLKLKKRSLLAVIAVMGIGAIALASCAPIVGNDQIPKNRVIVGNSGNFLSSSSSENNVAQKFKLTDFAKNALNSNAGQAAVLKGFVDQNILHFYQQFGQMTNPNWVESAGNSQAALKQFYQRSVQNVEQAANQLVADYQRRFGNSAAFYLQQNEYDPHGGSLASWKQQKLLQQLRHDFLQRLFAADLLNFDKTTTTTTTTHFEKRVLTNPQPSDVSSSSNWDKIGFYPGRDNELDKKFAHFQSYVFEEWFKNEQPFLVSMALWKYSNANEQQLASVYNKKLLDKANAFPKEASYSFPYFDPASNDSGTLNVTKKFDQFITNLDKFSNSTTGAINIPQGLTDDSATSILAKGSTIFDDLFPQFASGATHKYLQAIVKDNINNINELEKSSVDKTDIIKNFLTTTTTTEKAASSQIGVKFNKAILNNNNKDFSLEARDIKDSSSSSSQWMILRNQAGVHAIAIDGYQYITSSSSSSDRLKKLKQFLLYRALETKLGLNQNHSSKLDLHAELKKYFEQHTDHLLANYLITNSTSSSRLLTSVYSHTNIKSEEEALVKAIVELQQVRTDVAKPPLMRAKLLAFRAPFVKHGYTTTTTTDNVTTNWPSYQNGLASKSSFTNNFKIPAAAKVQARSLTNATNDDNDGNFPELMKLYNSVNDRNSFNQDQLKTKTSSYQTSVTSWVNKLNLASGNTSVYAQYLNTNNPIVNGAIDAYIKSGRVEDYVINQWALKDLSGVIDTTTTTTFKLKSSLENVDWLKTTTTTTMELKKAMQQYYYAKPFFGSDKKAEFGNFSSSNSSFLEKMEKIYEQQTYAASDEGYFLESKSTTKFIRLLLTLKWLLKDNYQNLAAHLRQYFNWQSGGYLIWSNLVKNDVTTTTIKEEEEEEVKKQFAFSDNPQFEINNEYFVSTNNQPPTDLKTNKNFNQQNQYQVVKAPFSSDTAAKTRTARSTESSKSKFIELNSFNGLVTNSQTTNPDVPLDAELTKLLFTKTPHNNNNNNKGLLNKFVSQTELLQTVKNIRSFSALKSLTEELKALLPNLKSELVLTDRIVLKSSSSSSSSSLYLNLEQRKNALYNLLSSSSSSQPSSPNNVTEEKYNSFYNTTTTTTTTTTTNDLVKSEYFERYIGLYKNAQGQHQIKSATAGYSSVNYVVQVNLDDFKDTENFKKLATTIGDDALISIAMQLALHNSSLQTRAVDSLTGTSNFHKLNVFDKRLNEAIDSKWINKIE